MFLFLFDSIHTKLASDNLIFGYILKCCNSVSDISLGIFVITHNSVAVPDSVAFQPFLESSFQQVYEMRDVSQCVFVCTHWAVEGTLSVSVNTVDNG